jgi:hypothetical protein
VTKNEAREIYNLQMALAQTFRRDIFELCERKGVPEEWTLDFVEEDLTFDRFFDRHMPDGSLKYDADLPRAERLKQAVRILLMGEPGKN